MVVNCDNCGDNINLDNIELKPVVSSEDFGNDTNAYVDIEFSGGDFEEIIVYCKNCKPNQ